MRPRSSTKKAISYARSTQRYHRTLSRSKVPTIAQFSNTELLELAQKDEQDISDDLSPRDRSKNVNAFSTASQANTQPILQQSPLIARTLVSARARHRRQKPPPSQERSSFQQRLQKNPYAHALSTTPRLCLLTGIRLPSYFQIPFGLAKHPVTNTLWHLPRMSGFSKAPAVEETATPTAIEPKSDIVSNSSANTRTVTGSHFIASRGVLAHISRQPRSAYQRLLPYRWKEDHSLKVPEIVWREDMDMFVLEKMRKSITEELDYLASRPAAYIASCKSPESIAKHDQVSAVLWLGDPSLQHGTLEHLSSSVNAASQQPWFYAMHQYKSHLIPYYNLLTLLGSAAIQMLRKHRPVQFDGEIAVIKSKTMTLNVQLAIWKLLGYLAESPEVTE